MVKDETILGLGAMVCGTVFGTVCLRYGVDGTIAFSIAAGIFGVGGYALKGWREARKREAPGPG